MNKVQLLVPVIDGQRYYIFTRTVALSSRPAKGSSVRNLRDDGGSVTVRTVDWDCAAQCYICDLEPVYGSCNLFVNHWIIQHVTTVGKCLADWDRHHAPAEPEFAVVHHG